MNPRKPVFMKIGLSSVYVDDQAKLKPKLSVVPTLNERSSSDFIESKKLLDKS
ncbi:MAG: hypothetical protein PVF15_09645 [Candidatus Bathyarchaeota archaeon]